jgi:hypothetical protein
MKLIQTLAEPTQGFWDGGKKQRFEWTIDSRHKSDNKGQFVKIGSWEANYWFHVSLGKTERQTLSYAMKHLKAVTKIPSTFSYQE